AIWILYRMSQLVPMYRDKKILTRQKFERRSRISVIEFVTLKATLRYRGDQQSLNNRNAGNFYVMAIDCLFPSAGHADGRFIFRCPVQNVCRMFGFWINLYVFGIFGMQGPTQAGNHANIDIVLYHCPASAER